MKKIKQNDISQNLYELLKKHNIPMKNVNEMFRTLGEAILDYFCINLRANKLTVKHLIKTRNINKIEKKNQSSNENKRREY